MPNLTKQILVLGFCASLLSHLHDFLLKWDVIRYVESDIDPKILPKDYQHGALLGVHSYDIGVEDEGFFALLKLLGCNELVEIHDGANHPVIAKILAEEKRLRTPLISWPLTADEPDSLSISFEEWLAAK